MYYDLAYAIKPVAVSRQGSNLYVISTLVGEFVLRSDNQLSEQTGILLVRSGCWVPNALLPVRMQGSILNDEGIEGACVSGAITSKGERCGFCCIEYDHCFDRPADVTHHLGITPSTWRYNSRVINPVTQPSVVLDKLVLMDSALAIETGDELYRTSFNRGVVIHLSHVNGRTLVQTLNGDSLNDHSNFTWNVLHRDSVSYKLPLLSETVLVVELHGNTVKSPCNSSNRRDVQLLAAYDRSTKRMYSFSELLTVSKLTGMVINRSGDYMLAVYPNMTATIY